MKHIIRNIKVSTGKHCLFSSFQDIAICYGYDMTESDLFFICNGLYSEYCNKDKSIDRKPSSNLSLYSGEKYAELFSEFIDAKLHLSTARSNEEDLSKLYGVLVKDRPLLVLIDPKSLYYHPRHNQMDAVDDSHTIMLYGINTEEDCVYIGDPYIVNNDGSISNYSGVFPQDVFLKNARGYAWFENEKAKKIDKELILNSMTRSIKDYLAGGIEEDSYVGQTGMLECIKDIQILEKMDSKSLEGACIDLLYWLTAHFFCIFDYIPDIIKKHLDNDIDNFNEYFSMLEKVKLRWRDFSLKLLKIAYSGEKSNISEVIEIGTTIIKKQEIILWEIVGQVEKSLRNKDLTLQIEGGQKNENLQSC